MSQISDEDKSLFAEAVSGTKKLKHRPKANPFKSKLNPKFINKLQTESPLAEEAYQDHHSVSAHESLIFQRKGVRLQEMQKLKKGQYPIGWQLDLHGYTELEANHHLTNFIQSALQEGIRSLLVIHGKGYNSDTDHPILKNLVNSRLRQFPSVLAFCSALQKDGGVGAVYVLLQNIK